MLRRALSITAFSCLLSAVSLTPPRALADTYSLVGLANSAGSIGTLGITSDGTVLLSLNSFSPPRYETYSPTTGFQNYGTTEPALLLDNGSSCTVANNGAFVSIGAAKCNNGYIAFSGSTGSIYGGIYSGLDPVNDLIYSGNSGQILLDSMGDIAFTAYNTSPFGNGDENLVAYDLTSRTAVTPEPSSFALLGTGLLGLAGVVRKRFV